MVFLKYVVTYYRFWWVKFTYVIKLHMYIYYNIREYNNIIYEPPH